MKKPFDVLAEGLVSKNNRGDWIRTSDLLVPNQLAPERNDSSRKEVTASPSSACTAACTSEGKNALAEGLEALAAALLGLSPADRARLAALLTAQEPASVSPPDKC